jgi:inorganic triphosphatase YgiF
MVEIELRFQVPEPHRAGLRRRVARGAGPAQLLHAVYFDTPDGRLAAAGMSLRLRREDRRWLQTVKGPADGAFGRIEHEVGVSSRGRGLPRLQLGLHDGTPAAALLRDVLGGGGTGRLSSGCTDASALHPVFETEVRRTRRLLRQGATVVELALDEGWLRAGTRAEPVFELELEWRAGPLAGLLGLADRWVRTHDLWLELRSKSARGAALAAAGTVPLPAWQRPALAAGLGADAALRAMVTAVLAVTLPAASAVAAGGPDALALHQLRVGLRRLRTALRLFAGASPAVDAAWAPALAALFDALGASRDRDALAESFGPALRTAGAPLPLLPPPPDAGDQPAQLLRRAEVGCLWLALASFGAGTAAQGDQPLAGRLPALLTRLHRQLVRDARHFDEVDDEHRHRTRRRVKRLRHAIDFVAALHPDKAVRRYLKRLQAAQDALGRYNDLCVAQQGFRALADTDPRAWFAVGWLQARRDAQLAQATAALRRLARARVFWRRAG